MISYVVERATCGPALSWPQQIERNSHTTGIRENPRQLYLRARKKGDKLGWQRLTDAETKEWRTHFLAYNGGSVEDVGWRRKFADGDESLSFWIAVGPNGHKAFVYSTKNPAGFLNALSERLGAPDNLDKDDTIGVISASRKRGSVEYSFVQVGSSATINVGTCR